jgi:hypothetical protein
MSKRTWKAWPGRIATELNGVSGVAGIGGTIMGVGGWAVLSGTMAAILGGGGLAVAAAAFGYAIVKAIPPAMRRPETLLV